MSKGDNFVKQGKFGPYVDIDAVVDTIQYSNHFLTIYGKRNEEIWVYENGIWEPRGREVIETMAERLLETWAKSKIVNEILKKIKRQTAIDREVFDYTDLNLIPLKNGVFDIKKEELIDYKPQHHFKFILPITYDKTKTCPAFLGFLEEIAYPEDIPVIQEWIGFNLYRQYFIKKAMIIKGPQDTGKSVFLDTLIEFIGQKNKTGIPLQKLTSGNDFTKLSLKDKHSNIYDDLSSKDLNDGGNFKIATGGGYISGEEKFGDYLQFKSFAKQTFATNKIPPVKDNDDLAYFGRWIVICFDNVPDKIDPFLRKKLHTENEMSGLFNWAMIGLKRILKNGRFSYNKSPAETKKIMEMSGDILIQFGENVLEKDESGRISKDEMYEIYNRWANAFNPPKPILSKEQLGRNLNKKVTYLVPKKDKERFWANVKVKEKWQVPKKLDTLDAFEKTYRKPSNNIQGLDIINKKASKPPKDDKDTLDAFSKEDLNIDERRAKEILEDFQ